ncbi:T7SS effector LXG polymorphic toxin [Sporosarcina sp. NCCP-2222]|uniref:T7SS effector LXG polymorphic toxin n=1 Tax=Sporosarcina sp. NCCP-2222 TaxID=2935073 RepID=UPI0020BF7BE7|nr:T7SS effector LXG polymorphic toxin [Sporosarcina sp. NCCP-2222]
MKILAVHPFQEGLRNMLSALNRLETEMKAIETTIETFVALDEAFKGEGGQAIRSFYDEVHLPFIQLFHMMQSDFVNVLERMTAALTTLEPHPSGWIQESFLEGEVEQGLDEIARITASLTDEANQIMNKVADIVALPHLDDSNVQDGIYTAKRKRDNTVTELNTFDSEQTNALIAIDNHLQVMERWIADASSLFTENTSDIHYETGQWAELLAKNLLQTDMAYRGTVLASVMTGSKSKEQLGKDLEATINEMEKVRDKEELEKLYDEMAKYSLSENVGLNRQAYPTDGDPVMDFRAVKGPVQPMFGGGMIPPGFGGFVIGTVKGALDFLFLEDVKTIFDKDTTIPQKAAAFFFLTPQGKIFKSGTITYRLSRKAMGGKIKKVEKVEEPKKTGGLEGTKGRDNGVPSYGKNSVPIGPYREVNGFPVKVKPGAQEKHIPNTPNYKQEIANGKNKSIFYGDNKTAQELLDKFAGKGQLLPNGKKERVDFGKPIGKYYDRDTGKYLETTKGLIHYGKDGAHIVPSRP